MTAHNDNASDTSANPQATRRWPGRGLSVASRARPAVNAYWRSVQAANYLHPLQLGYNRRFTCEAEMDDCEPNSVWWMDGQLDLFLGDGK